MRLASTLAETTVAILAGGLGSRLRTVVGNHPKVLAEINGRPFLAWLLEHLENFGFKRVVLCTGYKAEEIECAFGSTFGGLSIIHSCESVPLGTGGALRQALPFLGSNRVLALNGDSFCEADLEALRASHLARNARASMLLAWVEDAGRFGRVRLGSNDQITEFVEKGSSFGGGWINAGVYLLERDLIEMLPANMLLSLEREIFPMWIPQGVFGFKTQGRFLDIGTPESYALAQHEPLGPGRVAVGGVRA